MLLICLHCAIFIGLGAPSSCKRLDMETSGRDRSTSVNLRDSLCGAFLVLRRGVSVLAAVRTAMELRGKVLTNQYFRFLLVRAARMEDEPRQGQGQVRRGASGIALSGYATFW